LGFGLRTPMATLARFFNALFSIRPRRFSVLFDPMDDTSTINNINQNNKVVQTLITFPEYWVIT
jgi:hypothetical protein